MWGQIKEKSYEMYRNFDVRPGDDGPTRNGLLRLSYGLAGTARRYSQYGIAITGVRDDAATERVTRSRPATHDSTADLYADAGLRSVFALRGSGLYSM